MIMRAKLSICDTCGRSKEDDGFEWFCTGDPGDRHVRRQMRSAEFIEAGDLEIQLAALLDALDDEDIVVTPKGSFDLDALRAAYAERQWSPST